MKKFYFTLTLLMSSVAFFAQSAGDIIFTEIEKRPTGSLGLQEYFELYNTTAVDIDIVGWIIKDDEFVDKPLERFVIVGSLVVPAGGYISLSEGTTPDFTSDYVYSGVSFSNGDDGVILALPDDVTIIDQVNYTDAEFPDVRGAGMSLDPAQLNSVSNDVGANWCVSTTAMASGDFGTPGAANLSCPALGINDNAILGFNIYPNPVSNGFLNIQTLENASKSIQIFDLLGKQLFNQVINSTKLDVSNLKSGLYILKVSENGNTSTKKLVIK